MELIKKSLRNNFLILLNAFLDDEDNTDIIYIKRIT